MADVRRRRLLVLLPRDLTLRMISWVIQSALSLSHTLSLDLDLMGTNSLGENSLLRAVRGLAGHSQVIRVILVGDSAQFWERVQSEIQDHPPDLMLLDRTGLNQKIKKGRVNGYTQFISRLKIPTLLVSCADAPVSLPFRSVFVPMSGEIGHSSALEWAVEFANSLHLPVDILHVTEGREDPRISPSRHVVLGSGCDTLYYEYPDLVSEFLSHAIPYSKLEDQSVIRKFIHCSGIRRDEILAYAQGLSHPLLVMEWQGNLRSGHAQLLKRILVESNWPILLTRRIGSQVSSSRALRGDRAA